MIFTSVLYELLYSYFKVRVLKEEFNKKVYRITAVLVTAKSGCEHEVIRIRDSNDL